MAELSPEALLASLPGWAFALMLVLSRVSGVCILLPGLGEAEVPMTIRAGAALGMSLLLLPVLQPALPAMPENIFLLVGWIAGEVMCGLWLGWIARLPMLALPAAGQLAAGALGLSNVLQPDPTLGPQTSALSRLFAMAAPAILLSSGLYALPLAALTHSYQAIVPGTWLPAGDLAQSVTVAVGESFAFALQLAGPFIAAGIIWQVGMGVLARLVPQLQIYFAAMPGQILGGLLLLALLSGALLQTWQTHMAGISFGFAG